MFLYVVLLRDSVRGAMMCCPFPRWLYGYMMYHVCSKWNRHIGSEPWHAHSGGARTEDCRVGLTQPIPLLSLFFSAKQPHRVLLVKNAKNSRNVYTVQLLPNFERTCTPTYITPPTPHECSPQTRSSRDDDVTGSGRGPETLISHCLHLSWHQFRQFSEVHTYCTSLCLWPIYYYSGQNFGVLNFVVNKKIKFRYQLPMSYILCWQAEEWVLGVQIWQSGDYTWIWVKGVLSYWSGHCVSNESGTLAGDREEQTQGCQVIHRYLPPPLPLSSSPSLSTPFSLSFLPLSFSWKYGCFPM